jgi:hypothetical protein
MRWRSLDVVGVVVRVQHRALREWDELGVGACVVGGAGTERQLVKVRLARKV